MVAAWVIIMAIIIASVSNKPAKPEWDPIAHPGLVIHKSSAKDSLQQKHLPLISKTTAQFIVTP